jgi:hypothetical protein
MTERKQMTTPFGLTRQITLPVTFPRQIPGARYDRGRQVSVLGDRPLTDQPAVLNTWTTTWGTPRNDNATDDESK